MGDGTCYIEVFNLDQGAASLKKCAKEVANKPSCGNAFFFNENKGRCFCEKHGFTCIRMDRIYVNEYILNAGESNHSIQSWVSCQNRNESIKIRTLLLSIPILIIFLMKNRLGVGCK